VYVPKEWFDEAHIAKHQKCGVPAKLKFKTEPPLGLEMLAELAEQGPIPLRWVAVDEHYGMPPAFLVGIDRLDK
jgi:DDE superfamily endonuclease